MNQQLTAWSGEFGAEYTARNRASAEELNRRYVERYGCSRQAMNDRFLAEVPLTARILEIGTNVAEQLELLYLAGYRNLVGLDIQAKALEAASLRVPAEFVCGVATALPFPDASFDLVFTSGVLIHVSPEDLPQVMDEIYRCTRAYIWGFEYFDKEHTAIPYRGMDNLLWKGDFLGMFQSRYRDLRLMIQQQFPYLDNPEDVDVMYLLSKTVITCE